MVQPIQVAVCYKLKTISTAFRFCGLNAGFVLSFSNWIYFCFNGAIMYLARKNQIGKDKIKMKTTSTYAEHANSVYDLDMNCLSQGEDLFKTIQGMERVIVDNNAEWKKRSLAEPHRAFILGQAIDNEKSDLEGEFFNEEIREGRNNVYLLGLDFRNEPGKILIDRLDSQFRAFFKSPLPRLFEEVTTWNDPDKRLKLRDRIAKLTSFFTEKQMQERINEQLPRCVGNFVLSCCTAEFTYALLLVNIYHKDSSEREKFIQNHKNLFGDTSMIRDALFFDAQILSDDEKHVHKMASYCQICCLKSAVASA